MFKKKYHHIVHSIITGVYNTENEIQLGGSDKLWVGITPFIKRKETKDDLRKQAIRLRFVLDSLKGKEYIEWVIAPPIGNVKNGNEPPKHLFYDDINFRMAEGFGRDNGQYGFYDLSNHEVFVRLLPNGIDYAVDIDRNEVDARKNSIAIWIAALAFLATVANLVLTEIASKEKEQIRQEIQTRLTGVDTTVQNLQNDLGNLLQARRDDSIRNSLSDSTK